MKKIIIALTIFFVTSMIFAEKKDVKADKKSDTVTFSKEKLINYTIELEEHFKMNTGAPFQFYLKKDDKEILKKVKLEEFEKKSETLYKFSSDIGEKKFKYFFVACKYKDGKQIACKTFRKEKNID